MAKVAALKLKTLQPQMSLSLFGTIIPLPPPMTGSANILTFQFLFQVFVSEGNLSTYRLPVCNPGGVLPLEILPKKVIILTLTSGGDGDNGSQKDSLSDVFAFPLPVCQSVSTTSYILFVSLEAALSLIASGFLIKEQAKHFYLPQEALGNLFCSFPTLPFPQYPWIFKQIISKISPRKPYKAFIISIVMHSSWVSFYH